MMRHNKQSDLRSGAALVVVLCLVMACTLISLGFIARSDMELACGSNVETRLQMDYMAEVGLTHAKNFIINPQSVDTSDVYYWEGGTGLYVEDNGDYYDVSIVRDTSDSTDHCSYTVTSQGYRFDGGDKIAQSTLTAEFRLDPCVALWVGNTYTSESSVTINGDVYCNGELRGVADINGDAFAGGSISATNIEGDSFANNSYGATPVTFPDVDDDDLVPTYRIGNTTYSATQITVTHLSNAYGVPTMSNPAGIYYSNGDLYLWGNVFIYGVLVVKGDLHVMGEHNQVIKSKVPYNGLETDNYPAVVIGDDLNIREYGGLYVEGLVQIEHEIQGYDIVEDCALKVVGGVFIKNLNIDLTGYVDIDITAAPEYTALEYKTRWGSYKRWVSAGGGFYKTVERQ